MPKPKADLTLVFGKPSGPMGKGMGDDSMGDDGEDTGASVKFDEVAAEVMPDVDPASLRLLLDAYMEERGQ